PQLILKPTQPFSQRSCLAAFGVNGHDYYCGCWFRCRCGCWNHWDYRVCGVGHRSGSKPRAFKAEGQGSQAHSLRLIGAHEVFQGLIMLTGCAIDFCKLETPVNAACCCPTWWNPVASVHP